MNKPPTTKECWQQHNKQFDELEAFLDDLKINQKDARRKDTLIMTLHKAQALFGHLPEPVQVYIAQRYGISHAEVSGVISFYNYFTVTPKGKIQVDVCLGTACYVNGADQVLAEFERILEIKSGQVSDDGRYSLGSLRCVGACVLAPVVTINNKVYGKVKVSEVRDIIEHFLTEEMDELEVENA